MKRIIVRLMVGSHLQSPGFNPELQRFSVLNIVLALALAAICPQPAASLTGPQPPNEAYCTPAARPKNTT